MFYQFNKKVRGLRISPLGTLPLFFLLGDLFLAASWSTRH